MIIAATGHRPNKVGGYSRAAYQKLVAVAESYIRTAKPSRVISGMALGWDQAWAEAALNLGVPVIAAIPFAGQQSKWPIESQQNFEQILSRCESVTIVCPGAYSAAKMQKRNEWMVDRADRVCALWDGTDGGTANCVRYAHGKGAEVDNVWPVFTLPQESTTKTLDDTCAALYHPRHTLTEKGTCNMSIEALIKAHTEALLENTAAVKNLTLSLAGRSTAAASKAADAVDPVKAKADPKPKNEIQGAKADIVIVDEIEPKTDAAIPYETVRALLLKLAPTNRDGVKAVLTSAGIANLKVLLDKEDDFTTVNDQVKLEAVYADLQALEA